MVEARIIRLPSVTTILAQVDCFVSWGPLSLDPPEQT